MTGRLKSLLILALPLLLLMGCGDSSSNTPPSPLGAWLGEGTFNASMGSQEVTAQLELLPDGNYRFLILEPKILMLGGMEEGTYVDTGSQIDLTPQEEEMAEEGENRSVLFGRAPRNFRPKTLSIEGDYEALRLNDGKLDLTFEPNEEATEKLRASGDL